MKIGVIMHWTANAFVAMIKAGGMFGMENLGLWVLAITGAIFIAELVAGRHSRIYSRSDWFVNIICILIGSAVRPVAAAGVALLIGVLLPAGKGALSGV